MSPLLWWLAAVTVGSTALIAGPVSAWTRRYVREPFDDGDKTDADGDTADGTAPDAKDRIGSSTLTSTSPPSAKRPKYPALKHSGLLGAVPQGLLALALCVFCFWRGITIGATTATLVAIPVYALLGCAASVDAVAHLLPNRLLGATTVWLAACGVVAVVLDPDRIRVALAAALCALTVGGVGLALVYFRTGLGMGDVKLGATIGLWLGWHSPSMLVFGLCVGVFLGGITAFLLLVTRRASRKDPMAYGPYLIAGALLTWPLAVI